MRIGDSVAVRIIWPFAVALSATIVATLGYAQPHAVSDEIQAKIVAAVPEVVFEDSESGEKDSTSPKASTGNSVPIDGSGHILVNDKDANPSPERIHVLLPSIRKSTGKIIGRDSRTNLALIKIDSTDYMAPRHGNAADIREGDIVYARNASRWDKPVLIPAKVVNPKGMFPRSDFLIGPMIEVWLVDGNADLLDDFRGPLFNQHGDLIGFITLAGKSRVGNYRALAIRIDRLKRIAEDLQVFGKVRLPRLGTNVRQIPWDTTVYPGLTRSAGVQIDSLQQNGPAQRAGVRVGDVVIELRGEPIHSGTDFTIAVQKLKPGEQVEMHVLRKGEIHVFSVVAGEVVPKPKP